MTAQNEKSSQKKSAKKWVWIGALLIALVVIITLVSRLPNDQDILVKTDKSSDYSEQEGNLYRNTKYNFRITFPEGWEIKQDDSPNILRTAIKEAHSISIGVGEIRAKDLDKTETIKERMTLSTFKDNTMEGAQEGLPGAKLLDYGETKLGNIPTYWVKYSATYSSLDVNVEITNVMYQLLHKNIFYFISTATLSSEFAAVEPEFKKSIETFVIENY